VALEKVDRPSNFTIGDKGKHTVRESSQGVIVLRVRARWAPMGMVERSVAFRIGQEAMPLSGMKALKVARNTGSVAGDLSQRLRSCRGAHGWGGCQQERGQQLQQPFAAALQDVISCRHRSRDKTACALEDAQKGLRMLGRHMTDNSNGVQDLSM
jgi:hypothetical protein